MHANDVPNLSPLTTRERGGRGEQEERGRREGEREKRGGERGWGGGLRTNVLFLSQDVIRSVTLLSPASECAVCVCVYGGGGAGECFPASLPKRLPYKPVIVGEKKCGRRSVRAARLNLKF